MLITEEVALEIARAVKKMLWQIRRHDRSLFDQARRACASIALNVAEGRGSDGGNARARFATAAGSTRELGMALELAAIWGYVDARDVATVQTLLDRQRRLLWGLRR